MPSVSGDVRRRIVETAQASKVQVKTLPGLYELISGDLGLAGQLRPVQVEDVLGREQVEVDFEQVAVLSRRATRCSSRAPAARSARSCAARSRASTRRG